MKEPSVLLLRGCELLLQSPGFPFEKFKSITTLEISRCPNLTTLPEDAFSQMTHLQNLDFSYLQIDKLPDALFINLANCLRSLVLKGCSNLCLLPEPPNPMLKLEYLDLSHLPIETLPEGFINSQLGSLILRGCYKLRFLRLRGQLPHLHILDLCQCASLSPRETHIPNSVTMLDISDTYMCQSQISPFLSHLFFRNARIWDTEIHLFKPNMKVCDLSGSKHLKDVSMLSECFGLEALDASRTLIESIRFLSKLTSLRTLVLRDCIGLRKLPTVENLKKLQVLDLSGCEILDSLPQGLSELTQLKELNLSGCKSLIYLSDGIFDQMCSLETLDLSNTNISNLPSFANLINRGTVVNQSHDSIQESITEPTESSDGSDLLDIDNDSYDSLREFHLVSTFISNSEFDKFRYTFTELSDYISSLEEKLTRSVVDTEAVGVKRQFAGMRVDLEYIKRKIDLLESFENCNSEDLLHELMSYDYNSHSHDENSNSLVLKKLLRTVTKLKLLVPPIPPKPLSLEERRRHLKPPPLVRTNYNKHTLETTRTRLASHYESLTIIQRKCLLYFACIPSPIRAGKIKESILIPLWYGEGFFDDPLLCPNSKTIGEAGREILQALQLNGFIRAEGRRRWYMDEATHGYVITKAMEEDSFDFSNGGKLTPRFGISGRACLLKSDTEHPPSSHVWLIYTKNSQQLESFKNVSTLLYIDEIVVDINRKWFSSMTNLRVLHLVNLYSEEVNIVDLQFLEELKSMKKLRLLNLESFAAINKLPDSVCELTNLRILSLAYCSNLKELPDGIASLTNLIILDLTECHLLPRLPKGLALLSKLEVLKGFSITYEASGRQSRKACTLRELIKLKSLRKLNLVVNKDSFPDSRDLQVLRNMKALDNLKITWSENKHKEEEEEVGDTVEKGGLRHSRWNQLKCWGQHNETEEVEDELTNNCLENLNKLVLCCFSLEITPKWLNPTELPNLERLYVFGGSLKTFFHDQTSQATWKVRTLLFKYLSNLEMDWSKVEDNFPDVTSCKQYDCPRTRNFGKNNKVLCF